jgi:hypothetical protein
MSACQSSGGQGEIGRTIRRLERAVQGSTLMHELGHDLDLQHGRANSDNCKPNYMAS